MYIKNVSLHNFRNYEKLNIELNRGLNILYGANAQGKTNFLEAVYFCATSRSKRTNNDKELILFDRNESHLQVLVDHNSLTDRLDVHIRKEGSKYVAVNGIPVKRLGDLYGILYAVIFSPEDLQLIKAGPLDRRRFMDMEICQLSSVYYYDLQQYHKALKQRNNLLKEIQKNRDLKETLFVWDQQILAHGVRIIRKRTEFIQKINQIAHDIHFTITSGNGPENAEDMQIVYKPSVHEEDFPIKLNKNIDRDIFLGSTSVGIHKDDIVFYINNIEAKVYGSQGQQRTASLSAKLAEVELIRQEKGADPVLLLDDVLSELDASRQKFLIEYIQDIQTIITATGVEDLIQKVQHRTDITIFEVKNNSIYSPGFSTQSRKNML